MRLMISTMLGLLVACGDKEAEDTAVEAEEVEDTAAEENEEAEEVEEGAEEESGE